jgi:hypothetical protein
VTGIHQGDRNGPSGPVFVSATPWFRTTLVATACAIVAAWTTGPPALADGASITPFATAPLGADVPPGWEVTKLPKVPRATTYRIVDDGGVRVLQAEAQASMAGLTHRLKVDPRERPRLAWRWKVSRVVEQGVFGTKRSDDFAARVYVLFDYDVSRLSFATRMKLKVARMLYGDAVPAAALCYVWDARAPEGASTWSPFTDRMRMIVATSGAARAGQWVTMERDVAADFRAAFGEDAPPIIAVAVATDTDNTGEAVTAWYEGLSFPPPSEGPMR